MKNGKKPLSQKPVPQLINEDDIFGNPYALDEELKKEIKAKNLEARFVNYSKLVEQGGYHQRGWKVYKRDKKEEGATLSSSEFHMGSNPDGSIRRGHDVLAVRPKSVGDKHRQLLKQRAQVVSSDKDQDTAEELRRYARDNQLDVTVQEGYDDKE